MRYRPLSAFSNGRYDRVLIPDEFSDVVFDTLLGCANAFFCKVPYFRMSGGSLLCFGIECCCCDHQKIFTDLLDPILPALIISKCLPMEEHHIKNRPCKPTACLFDEAQFGADPRILELFARGNRLPVH